MQSLALGDRLSSAANRRQWAGAVYGTDLGLDGHDHAMVILHLLHEVHRRHWLAEAFGFGRRTPLSASWMEIAGLDEIPPYTAMVFTVWFQREHGEALLYVAIMGHILVKSDEKNDM
jgi:hypothetical protein